MEFILNCITVLSLCTKLIVCNEWIRVATQSMEFVLNCITVLNLCTKLIVCNGLASSELQLMILQSASGSCFSFSQLSD